MAYVAAIRSALGTTSGWRLISYGAYGCSFIDMAPSDAQLEKDCPQRRQKAIEAVNRVRPDVVFVANRSALRTKPGADQPMTPVEQTTLLRSEFAKLTGAGKLVLLAAPPPDKSIESCYTKTSRPADCVGGVSRDWLTIADTEQALAVEFKGAFVNSRDWFCYKDQCPSFVGSTLTKRDRVHMTKEYAERIGPVILEQLRTQKIVRLEKD